MTTRAIHELIDKAIARERRTHEFQRQLEPGIDALRRRLRLPEPDASAALVDFVIDYVRAAPGALDLAASVGRYLDFYDYVAPFIYLAEDFFLHPVENSPNAGLQCVLREAFLAHRLIEEVNDHHMRLHQRPLLPIDMTEANIIVHHLLGDAAAIRLESLVAATAARQLLKFPAGSEPDTSRPRSVPMPARSRLPAPTRVRLRLEG
ncbi:hypothetical protein [Parahaliea mediterranea]|uniref:Uncharacterized protein n=1 Tax=Parahaliea mediterranea TaxID=651086 RepID=A0A939DFI8_9GAMM|nr:hypothetical protein [Parahaliea mediterranea]MBN7797109.1 hypothetical protein [Parahaliea mediterranea]